MLHHYCPRSFRSALLHAGRFAACAAVAASASLAWAQATWTGTTNQDWNTASNWSSDPSLPSGNITVNTATGNYPVIGGAPGFTPVDIFIGSAGNAGRIDQSAGTLATGTGNWFFIGDGAGSTGTYNLTGSSGFSASRAQAGWGGGIATWSINTSGTVSIYGANSADWWRANAWDVGRDAANAATVNVSAGTVNVTAGDTWLGSFSGEGTLNQSGGTINLASLQVAKFWNGTAGTSKGTAAVTGGTLNASSITIGAGGSASDFVDAEITVGGTGVVTSEGDLTIGFAGNASSTGSLVVNAGGTVNVGSTTQRWMIVGQYDSVTPSITVNTGGVLNLNAGTDLRTATGNNAGSRVIDINGGSLIGTPAAGGDASLIELGRNANGSDTLTIQNGGLVVAQAIFNNAASTSAIINFDNGTLRALGDDVNLINLAAATTRQVNVLSGGAVIDSNGANVQIHNGLLDGGGGGGLTKNGLGTLTLSGTSTYTGATVVNAGTLVVTGALSGTSGLTLATGAAIGGTGSIAGNLTFGSGTQLAFDPLTPLTITGTATFASPSTFGIDDILGVSSSTPAGTYTLIAGTVDTTGLANLGPGNAYDLGGGVSAYFQSGSLQMVVVPEPAMVTLGGLATAAAVWLVRRRR